MFLAAAAILPAVILIFYFYKKDKLEPESPRILGKCVLGGLLAAVASMILESIVAIPINAIFGGSTFLFNLIENFIGVALIDEGTKLLFCYLFTWKDREFNYRFDGLVYMVFTSLGFAAIENVLYAFTYGSGVLLSRALLSIPGHAGFAVFLGSYYGTAKIYEAYDSRAQAKNLILFGLLMSTLMHGFYDFCLSFDNGILIIIFFAFVIAMDVLVIRRINRDSANNRLIHY